MIDESVSLQGSETGGKVGTAQSEGRDVRVNIIFSDTPFLTIKMTVFIHIGNE